MPPRPGVGLSRLAYDLTRLADERAAGRAAAPDPRVTGRAPLPPHRVANALIARGLLRPALDLLRAAEEGPVWGADDDFLLAMLLATGDPRGASLRLRRASFRLAAAPDDPATGALQRDATLAALLLDVRGRQMGPAPPGRRWSSGWTQRAPAGWTARAAPPPSRSSPSAPAIATSPRTSSRASPTMPAPATHWCAP
jgi:hypothetical protein